MKRRGGSKKQAINNHKVIKRSGRKRRPRLPINRSVQKQKPRKPHRHF